MLSRADAYVPIGDAIAGASLWQGEDGEMLLGGPCPVVGYRNDMENKTQGKFTKSASFRSLENASSYEGDRVDRLYHTGDLVSMREGYLCFLKRKDNQVKLRGHRPELGEIEAVYRAMPEVEDCLQPSC